jgi:hypothetical protein
MKLKMLNSILSIHIKILNLGVFFYRIQWIILKWYPERRNGEYISLLFPINGKLFGVLWWPEHLPHSSREQLRSKTATAPEEKWIQYPCFLKCSGIINFKEALGVEKELTQYRHECGSSLHRNGKKKASH